MVGGRRPDAPQPQARAGPPRSSRASTASEPVRPLVSDRSISTQAAAATPGKEGYLTLNGKSVGECKLWATLHMLVMIKSDVLAPFPALTAFYERFGGEAATKRASSTPGGRFPGR